MFRRVFTYHSNSYLSSQKIRYVFSSPYLTTSLRTFSSFSAPGSSSNLLPLCFGPMLAGQGRNRENNIGELQRCLTLKEEAKQKSHHSNASAIMANGSSDHDENKKMNPRSRGHHSNDDDDGKNVTTKDWFTWQCQQLGEEEQDTASRHSPLYFVSAKYDGVRCVAMVHISRKKTAMAFERLKRNSKSRTKSKIEKFKHSSRMRRNTTSKSEEGSHVQVDVEFFLRSRRKLKGIPHLESQFRDMFQQENSAAFLSLFPSSSTSFASKKDNNNDKNKKKTRGIRGNRSISEETRQERRERRKKFREAKIKNSSSVLLVLDAELYKPGTKSGSSDFEKVLQVIRSGCLRYDQEDAATWEKKRRNSSMMMKEREKQKKGGRQKTEESKTSRHHAGQEEEDDELFAAALRSLDLMVHDVIYCSVPIRVPPKEVFSPYTYTSQHHRCVSSTPPSAASNEIIIHPKKSTFYDRFHVLQWFRFLHQMQTFAVEEKIKEKKNEEKVEENLSKKCAKIFPFYQREMPPAEVTNAEQTLRPIRVNHKNILLPKVQQRIEKRLAQLPDDEKTVELSALTLLKHYASIVACPPKISREKMNSNREGGGGGKMKEIGTLQFLPHEVVLDIRNSWLHILSRYISPPLRAEGIIVRVGKNKYKPDSRSPSMFKIVPGIDSEFKVLDVVPTPLGVRFLKMKEEEEKLQQGGNADDNDDDGMDHAIHLGDNRHQGAKKSTIEETIYATNSRSPLINSVQCVTESGKIFGISGQSAPIAQQIELLKNRERSIAQWATVRYPLLTSEGRPRAPKIKGVRGDPASFC